MSTTDTTVSSNGAANKNIHGTKRALIIVDMQNDFVTGTMAIQGSLSIVSTINELRNLRSFDHVVITKDWHPQDHCSFASNAKQYVSKKSPISPKKATVYDHVTLNSGQEQVLWPDHCVQQSWGSETVSDLDRHAGDIEILKGTDPEVDSYSAFFDNGHKKFTELAEKLRAAGVGEVYACGLAFDYCVGFTAIDARELGFKTTVITDACKSVAEDSAETMVEQLTSKGVTLATSGQIKTEFARTQHRNKRQIKQDWV